MYPDVQEPQTDLLTQSCFGWNRFHLHVFRSQSICIIHLLFAYRLRMGSYAGIAFHHPDQCSKRRTHGDLSGTVQRNDLYSADCGSILALFTPKGMLPPEINMLVMAGVMLIIGAVCVYLIKETKGEQAKA